MFANDSSFFILMFLQDSESENTGRINNSRCGNVDNDGTPFVNEAFVADWRPGTSSGLSCSNLTDGNLPSDILPQKDIQSREQSNKSESGDMQIQKKNVHWFSSGSKYSEPPSSISTSTRHVTSNTNAQNLGVSDVKANASNSPIYSRNYRARKCNSSHLVKLAPDLPPVNLPPSVRVVPQSFFKGSMFGAPGKAFVAKSSNDKEISQVADTVGGRLNKSNPLNDTNNSIPLMEDAYKLNVEECRANNDKSTEGERGTDSDLHMHPLLFRASDDGSVPYYRLNCSSGSSDSFSFFSGNQPQLNLSLFYNPQPEYHIGFEKLLKSKKFTSSSRGIDFHPLLQRTDDINQVNMAAHLDAFVSCSGGRSPNAHDIFGALQNQPSVSNGKFTRGTEPTKHGDKTYGLDLEMHLSSTSNKETVPGNRVFTAHDQLKSTADARNSEALENLHNSHLHVETCQRTNDKGSLVSDAHPLVLLSVDNSSDDVDEHSHPGIIMEQEELSDTDEEVEENVEFECEEMADSEGEDGSDCEPSTDLQHKVIYSC